MWHLYLSVLINASFLTTYGTKGGKKIQQANMRSHDEVIQVQCVEIKLKSQGKN